MVVVVLDSQHVPNIIGVISIGFLFWTVMKEYMAKKVFHSPFLATVLLPHQSLFLTNILEERSIKCSNDKYA